MDETAAQKLRDAMSEIAQTCADRTIAEIEVLLLRATNDRITPEFASMFAAIAGVVRTNTEKMTMRAHIEAQRATAGAPIQRVGEVKAKRARSDSDMSGAHEPQPPPVEEDDTMPDIFDDEGDI